MKRLLLFPGHRLLAYEWERGRFLDRRSFAPDDAGRESFRSWLSQAPRIPVQLLLDVIEEEFHIDHVPHVIGRDRIELHRRTAEKHFRQTEFRYLEVQGRERAAREDVVRRDDRVLVAGLTNPEILTGWVSLIDEARVPLKSIHSLPLVGEWLLPALGATRSSRVLMISQQIPSTLRQSYYEDGQLRFSRLVPGRYESAAGFAEFVNRELRQTLHFLETHRFRRRDDPVQVYVLCDREGYHALRDRLSSSDAATCHLVSLERLSARVGVRGGPEPSHADAVFAHTLLRQRRPTNHYGVARLRRHFIVQRARVVLQGVAALLVVVAVGIAGAWYLQGQAYQAGAREARKRAEQFDRLYQQRLHQLDAFDYQAVDIKKGVDLLSTLDNARFEHPGRLMAAIGGALAAHEDIVLDRFNWHAVDASAESARGRTAVQNDTASRVELAEAHGPLVAGARLEGQVVGFGGDYRRGIEIFEAFVAALRTIPALTGVEVVAPPFDIGTDSAISGDSGTAAARRAAERASFTLIVRGASTDEAA